MLFYVCPTCGRWQDVSFVKAISDVFASVGKALNQPPQEQLGYPCPAGHGLMVAVQPTDRVYVRAGVIESTPDEQERALDEIAQLSQDLGLYD